MVVGGGMAAGKKMKTEGKGVKEKGEKRLKNDLNTAGLRPSRRVNGRRGKQIM